MNSDSSYLPALWFSHMLVNKDPGVLLVHLKTHPVPAGTHWRPHQSWLWQLGSKMTEQFSNYRSEWTGTTRRLTHSAQWASPFSATDEMAKREI